MASDDCRGKTKYPTLAEAQRGLELAQRTWRYPPARWYACDVCGGYHLTGKRAQAGNLDLLTHRRLRCCGRGAFPPI